MKPADEKAYAVVTGASSGIGWELARELGRRGFNLIIVARRRERLEQLRNELLAKHTIDVVVIDMDLGVLDNCHQLHEMTKAYAPTILINNAGFGQYGFSTKIPLDKELEMIRLNIESLHVLTKLYVLSMEKGVILNVASMAAFVPTPLLASYAATKAYVASFSRALDYELGWKKTNIRVLSLCPGPVESEFGLVANARQTRQALKAAVCARIAVKGIMKRRPIIIPGALMKIAYVVLKLLPTRWVLPSVFKIQKHK